MGRRLGREYTLTSTPTLQGTLTWRSFSGVRRDRPLELANLLVPASRQQPERGWRKWRPSANKKRRKFVAQTILGALPSSLAIEFGCPPAAGTAGNSSFSRR